MASIKAYIRTFIPDKLVNVRYRVSCGQSIQLYYTSNIEVRGDSFDSIKQQIKQNTSWKCDRLRINRQIFEIKQRIESTIESLSKDELKLLTSETLQSIIDKTDTNENEKPIDKSIHSRIIEYYIKKRLGHYRIKGFESLSNIIRRFERYYGIEIVDDIINYDLIVRFDHYIRIEHTLYEKHRYLWEIKLIKKPSVRAENTIAGIMQKVRTLCNFLYESEYIVDNSYLKYKISQEVYGTPYFLSKEELVVVYEYDFQSRPNLEIQRDIFIFQCLVGCRVSDLLMFTPSNIIESDYIEYVQSKGNKKTGEIIRIPLTDAAKKLIEKYRSDDRPTLFPFIKPQKYNQAIKKILYIAGVTRRVTILDPKTRKEKQVPINEVASSHMARRTFTGLIYKTVKDPNIVGKMTGHVEGSKAIARYRTIDDDIKKEAVSSLDIL